MRSSKITIALLAAVLVAGALVRGAEKSSKKPLLADSRLNAVWVDGEKRSTIVYDAASGGEPVLVLNKPPFQADEIRLEVTTDARAFVISSGPRYMTLKLAPSDKHRLILDGRPGKEKIELNNDELRFQRSEWAQLIGDTGFTTFQIFFEGAKEIAITFKAARDQPVR